MRVAVPANKTTQKLIASSKRRVLSPKSKRALQDIADADWSLIASRTQRMISTINLADTLADHLNPETSSRGLQLQRTHSNSFRNKKTKAFADDEPNVQTKSPTSPKQMLRKASPGSPKLTTRRARQRLLSVRSQERLLPVLGNNNAVEKDNTKERAVNEV